MLEADEAEGRRPGVLCFYHSLHAMWKQQHDAVLSNPLGLARTDELVDDALSGVVKVSKLGLPQNQRVRTGHGEA